MDIMDYCKKEWRGNTQKATCKKKTNHTIVKWAKYINRETAAEEIIIISILGKQLNFLGRQGNTK